MSRGAYYNEFDPFAAEWLRKLMLLELIAPGDVDERSIEDVTPDDLRGYSQCHFFAGIAVWSHALRRAGWDDDREIWTGSCPCQPFSAAGKGDGFADERHLWPAFFHLIRECRPGIVIGEQVSSADAVGGAVAEGADLQILQDRSAFLGVLRQLKRAAPHVMQGLREGSRESAETHGPRENGGAIQTLAGRQAGLRTGEHGAAPRDIARPSVLLGQGGHPGEGRQGRVRVDGDPVRLSGTESVERALPGPDQAGGGLHASERPRGAVRPECDGEYLGTESDIGDCVGDFESAREAQRRLLESLGVSPEGEDGSSWVDTVQSDLEGEGYAFGAGDTCAAGFGAPHIRQRLYWAGVAAGREAQGLPDGARLQVGQRPALVGAGRRQKGRAAEQSGRAPVDGVALGDPQDQRHERPGPARRRGDGPENRGDLGSGLALAHDAVRRPDLPGRDDSRGQDAGRAQGPGDAELGRGDVDVADAHGRDAGAERQQRSGEHGQQPEDAGAGHGHIGPGPTNGFWRDADWLGCRDAKWRPVEPGSFPLAHGSPRRVGLLRSGVLRKSKRVGSLRGYGNAVCAPVAEGFIEAVIECLSENGATLVEK